MARIVQHQRESGTHRIRTEFGEVSPPLQWLRFGKDRHELVQSTGRPSQQATPGRIDDGVDPVIYLARHWRHWRLGCRSVRHFERAAGHRPGNQQSEFPVVLSGLPTIQRAPQSPRCLPRRPVQPDYSLRLERPLYAASCRFASMILKGSGPWGRSTLCVSCPVLIGAGTMVSPIGVPTRQTRPRPSLLRPTQTGLRAAMNFSNAWQGPLTTWPSCSIRVTHQESTQPGTAATEKAKHDGRI